jgi:hypothetical protein
VQPQPESRCLPSHTGRSYPDPAPRPAAPDWLGAAWWVRCMGA